MINIIISIIIILNLIVLSYTKNPIKTRFFILTLSSISFLLIKLETRNTWFPLLFFLLFNGGILLIFIILSSIIPNEKSIKIKTLKLLTLISITIILYTISIKIQTQKSNFNQIKRFLTSTIRISLIIVLILLYFFNTARIIKIEESPIRSLLCWKKNNFVNY